MRKPLTDANIITLSGGVGGAKLVLGLEQILSPENLTVIANTGDDFDHLGLRICPDIDTLLYTLSGLSDQVRGWGRADESWQFMDSLPGLGGENWFNLGDRDLALHVIRTQQLNAGHDLSELTANIAQSLGIKINILPMSNQPVATMVHTTEGVLPFQHYFVRYQCAPEVTGFKFEGIDKAIPNPALVNVLKTKPDAIIIAPSNPYVSIDPILSVPGMRDLLRDSGVPVIAVSPIVNGTAIKGPAAKMMAELGVPATALQVARHYQGFVDGFIIDESDADLADNIAELGMTVLVTPTIMNSLDDRIKLAKSSIEFAGQVSRGIYP